MKVVADTNAFLAVALGEQDKQAIVDATRGSDLIAPEILPYEIGNALSSLFRRGLVSSSQALAAWEATQRIPVESRPVDIMRALALATEQRIFAYDAYFLECALQARAPLLTLDKKMRAVAQQIGIPLVMGDPQ
jgi:predicted nucleic acid-binding protein